MIRRKDWNNPDSTRNVWNAKFGYRPLIFLSNGYATEFVDDENGPSVRSGGVFSQDDLQRIMNRRREAIDPRTVPVNEKVAGRYYQIEAIKSVLR